MAQRSSTIRVDRKRKKKGFNFFPSAMMDGYKVLKFSGESETMMLFAMGLAGVQTMQWMCVCAAMRTPDASEAAAAACVLANALFWLLIAVSDGARVIFDTLPTNLPKETISLNCFVFLLLASMNVNAWIAAGMPKPEIKSLVPKGPLATPMLVMMGNLAGFGIGCFFFTEPFVEQFVPGLLGKFAAGPKAAILMTIKNAGLMMLMNIVSTCLVSAADKGSADTNYRLLRAWVYGMFFYMGKFADEAVTASCTGWQAPARVPSFVTCFASLFFAATSLGSYPITVAKKPKTA